MEPTRNPFGRLLVDPDKLPARERWDCLRRLAGTLQSGRTLEEQWLGRKLLDRLHDGGDLEDMLGLRPARGSTKTPERCTRLAKVSALLVQLSAAAGGDVAASRILTGQVACPERVRDLVTELRAMRAPTSRRAFTRARSAPSHAA